MRLHSKLPDIVPANREARPHKTWIGAVRDGARTAAELLLHLSVTATLTLSTTISLHSVRLSARSGLDWRSRGLTNLAKENIKINKLSGDASIARER